MQSTDAILEGDTVLVPIEAEASRLFSKGHFGVPESGGALRLHLLEAIYLVEKERICVHSPSDTKDVPIGPVVDLGEILTRAVKAIPSFEVRFSVYSDLRDRGYLIASPLLMARADGKVPEWDLEAYQRGTNPGVSSKPDMRIFSLSERAELVLADIIAKVQIASHNCRRTLIALVDEEGDATYYEVETSVPKGQVSSTITGLYQGQLLEDRVVITGKDAHALHENGYFGKPSAGSLQLSFLEAAYLLEKGVLEVKNARTGKSVGHKAFLKIARERQSEFDQRLQAYTDLRDKGLVVKTGFKYGTHFRVYQGAPSNTHARFLMHAVPQDFKTTWPELSRAVRLAHGVRKEILFSRVLPEKMEYIEFKRVRP
jgi:tRNA-intron endonuclease